MQSRQTRTRRDTLGLAALAASMVVIGNDAGAAVPSPLETSRKASVRPTREEMARAASLYAGEFGGGVGAR
ncbi:MAG TPA: hypothetical protein VKB67_05845 [Rhizomicrobium sp.]|nr:hypothetical protein [Rhizomicrobium sp.]